jgi:DNA integrity scanning protein DisA with diadenylate cyclase activity
MQTGKRKNRKSSRMLSEQDDAAQSLHPAEHERHKSYTLKVQPIYLTAKTRNNLTAFARLHPNLLDDFLDEAKRTLAANERQIAKALNVDLTAYFDQFRTVYDILSRLKELETAIPIANKEAADLVIEGAHSDVIAAVNEKISDLHKNRSVLMRDYVAPLRSQHIKGKQLVFHMRNRLKKSIDEVERVKAFYCSVCRAIGKLPPDEFRCDRKAEEASLIKIVYEKEIISAIREFGAMRSKDGTIKVSIIELGGDFDDNENEADV